MNTRSKGYLYERKAKEYLESLKIKIIETNYYGYKGEIDLIGYDLDTLVFFEVKYRKNKKFGLPQEAINLIKKKKIYFTAKDYITKRQLYNKKIRFDAILFIGDEIQWLKNIIWGDELGI